MRRALRALLLLLAALSVAAGAAALAAWRIATAPGPLPEERNIVIPRGGIRDIAEVLEREGVIRDADAFALAALLTRSQGPLRAGEYAFPAGASLFDALAVLRFARPVQRRFTIAEGMLAVQIRAALEAEPALTGPVPPFAEGALLPETYLFSFGDSRESLVRRAAAAMEQALAQEWERRAPNLPFSTPREALILASIVERETGVAEERARVAGVFVNRLRRGMLLQSDPTTAYAAAGGGVLERPLTRADLQRDHPFNTYRVPGLPPGPIASPGRAAIRAALNPEAHDFLYFVADGTGGHAFARTLEEHNRNVARWRQIERERGQR
ncbi:MAG: endolytic transglycosylase MltG [Acetobacteraceae bacterium]|nr:endolytic transglycosylase MltG [Acetobacteraceae bacterium]